MTVQLGSLSPIAPPTPSPNPPRASISSNRSFRRTEADFEAALLNPAATIFLSAAPTLGEQLGPASPPRNDHDAPQPVEKRSFEEDMVPAVTAVKNVGVIPPTPSTMRSDRRLSTTTKGSVKSTPNGMSGSRKMGQSFGIDGGSSVLFERCEILICTDELQEGKKATVKRKSIFRSPGTASSPDLATLVRKAKEAKAANGDTVPPTIPAQAKGPPRPTKGMVLSHSIQSHASSSSTKSRNRSTSQASRPQEVSWERFSNGELRSMPTGERMATILEGSGRRSRQSSGEEGFKVSECLAWGIEADVGRV